MKIIFVFPYWLIICTLLVLILAGCAILPQPAQQPIPSLAHKSAPPTSIPPLPITTVNVDLVTPTMEPSGTPSITPAKTPLIASSTPVLPLVEGNMTDLIVQLEADAPRQGSQGFVQPDQAALSDFLHLAEELLAGNTSPAAEIAMQDGYELVIYRDLSMQNEGFYLLRENRPIQRAWGLYIISLDACRDSSRAIIVEAPHILADEGTPQIALDTFRSLRACALMVAGAHRGANWGGNADVAHNSQTVFNSIQTAIANAAGPATLVLQIHGFAAGKHPGYPSIVLGGSPAGDSAVDILLRDLSQSLADQGLSTGLCDGINWANLCGETNVLANSLPAGGFIHLEIDEISRLDPGLLINTIADVFRVRP